MSLHLPNATLLEITCRGTIIIFVADPVGVDVCVSVTLYVLVCISHELVDKFAWI